MRFFKWVIWLVFLFPINSFAQVVINEFVSTNTFGVKDEDGNANDWIELYNKGNQAVNLAGYKLSDKPEGEDLWTFPQISLNPQEFLLVFASGEDRKTVNSKYNTIIKQGDIWRYFIPSGSNHPAGWRNIDFNDGNWQQGPSGFGYADGDDATILQGVQRLLIRKMFQVEDPTTIDQILFHCDYDDGFIAFINGKEIARGNISSANADFTNVALGSDREAKMYSGGKPEEYVINNVADFLVVGANVIAIQGHNISSTSSDFSLIPFLTLASSAYENSNVPAFITERKQFLHTNFKIKAEGEALFLFDNLGNLIDNVPPVELLADVSYGRFPDGADTFFYFLTPTPKQANQNPIDKLIRDEIIFSHQPGLYSSAIQVALSSKVAGGEIFYTTNGTTPDATSTKYTAALNVSKTTALRAAVVRNGFVSGSFTNTYFIGGGHALPVVSLSTTPENLWDYNTGIYVMGPNAQNDNPHFGANFWMDWEKPVQVEYFDRQRVQRINQTAGFKISGNWTRANAQKSLAFFARKSYEKGKFEYPFFNDKVYKSFNNFLLRNSGNDWSYSMFRDGLVSELAKGMDIDRLAFQPSVVYINGEYWGIQNMREKPNSHYFESNYGIPASMVTILENNASSVDGSNADYLQLLNLVNGQNISTEAVYSQAATMMDVDAYIDYMIIELFVHNDDWPGNNIKYWKTSSVNSRWRWILFDTDFGFGLYNTAKMNQNTLVFATTTNGPNWPNPPWSTQLFRRLLLNNTFKNKFINRYADCLNTNLSSAFIISKIDSIREVFLPEINSHLSRWGHNRYNWDNNIQQIKNFANQRPPIVRGHIRSFFSLAREWGVRIDVSHAQGGVVQLNSLRLSKFPFNGSYFQQVPITITAYPKQGYRFVRWEGTYMSLKPTMEINLTGSIALTAIFEPVSSQMPQIVINEINYKAANDHDTGDWIELYNNGDQVVDLSQWTIADSKPANAFTIPNGTLLYPGEYLVLFCEAQKFRQFYPVMHNSMGELTFNLSSDGEIIRLYSSTNQLVDQVVYQNISPWPSQANGLGATLELANPNRDNAIGNNWHAGINGGSPGRQNGTFNTDFVLAVAAFEANCFPTRFSDYTTLRFNTPASENYKIEIVDLAGRLRTLHSGRTNASETIAVDLFRDDHASFERGMYLVRLSSANLSKVFKVIKQ